MLREKYPWLPENLVYYQPVAAARGNPATMLARKVVIPSLLGSKFLQADWAHTQQLIIARYVWIKSLLDVGTQISEDVVPFMYNCPPCVAVVTPSMRQCRRRMCPWCWGRKAIGVFDRLRQRMPMRFIVLDRTITSVMSLRVDPMDVTGQLRDIWQKQVALRKAIQHKVLVSGGQGIYYRLTIAPPLVDAIDPYWRITHRALVAVPPAYKAQHWLGDDEFTLRQYKPHARELVTAVGRVLRYPTGWFHGHPELIKAIWETFNSTPCCTAAGTFRGLTKEKT